MIKSKLILLFLALLLFSHEMFAQNKTEYSRMNGQLGGNIKVTGNFQRAGSNMEGNYSYNLYVNDSLLHLSHIIKLYGGIDSHNKVVLRQLSNKDSLITGLFTDHRFTGSWHGPDSTMLPFSFSEIYPEGSLPMAIFYLHSGKDFVPKAQGTPSAEIELTLLYPKNSSSVSPEIVDSVKKFIQKSFFGQYKSEQAPQTLLYNSEKNFYSQFDELNSHWKTNRKLGFDMVKREQVTVIFNGYHLLCLQYKKQGYAGRGNPLEHISYDMVDLRNGKKLTLENILIPTGKAILDSLVNKKIRENNGLSDSTSLKTIGFFHHNIPLSRNISFSGNGLTMVYNVYDIAPPALGIQKVFLPFSEMGRYIKPSSVLYPLSR